MVEQDVGGVEVVLVDDEALVRAGLRMILGGAPDITVLAEAGDGLEALDVVARHRPDVVLMDIRMPRLDGISACDQMVRRYADDVRVIVLTTFDTDDLILRALRVGASGFLLKDTPPDRLVQAVRAVADGEPMLSPTITASLMSRVASSGDDDRGAAARHRLDRLTDREREVAIGVGEGLSNAQIGRQLYLSVPTVKAHVSRVLTKLEAANRVQVAITVHDARQSR
ncbi:MULTISPECIES: response regulator transcription factor [Allobranchiibius]|uniref:DNA-binding NarL/FixJ family response regulator n=1 Tax=Allobranchiibius huperziae TaxID=1874116 RepID=A0A853D8D9_9MICO|nr:MULTISPECIES: response regulator transcription factor [Allobranchiibius]MBO1765868.1 response regulator transcription factor [Allobranchiibius sp. GilTou38]NYJ73706.1 DNA-binding NarL/FixJ family response regulator [Allobranchiibius huperziae]